MEFRYSPTDSEEQQINANSRKPPESMFSEKVIKNKGECTHEAKYAYDNLAASCFMEKRMAEIYPEYQGNQKSDKGIFVQV